MKRQSCFWGKDDVFSLYAESIIDDYTPFWSNHAYEEFMFPVKGDYDLCIGDRTYTVRENNIVFINNNQLHKVIPRSREEFQIVSFVVNWTEFSKWLKCQGLCFDLDLLRQHMLSTELFTVSTENLAPLQDVFHNLYEELEAKKAGQGPFLYALLLQSFILLNRELLLSIGETYVDSRTESLSDNIAAIVDYIGENYHEQISLSHIARQFWINPSQLSRNFKREIGVNITEFIRATRMYYAKELLIKTSKNVSEIGFDVGYNNTAYFNTVFLQETGVSPSAFRQGYTKNGKAVLEEKDRGS